MSLLKELQQLTERTYHEYSGINLEKFIIGKKRFGDLANAAPEESRELSSKSRIFFRVLQGRLYLAIYFSEYIISKLEKHDPRMGLHEKNISPFMVFIEEINHAIHTALKFMDGESAIHREDFIRDLELIAKIDTYQILKYFLAHFNSSKQLEKFDRLWLRHHLFERCNFSYKSVNLATRYAEVNWLGEKYVRYLDGVAPHFRLSEMRRFRGMAYPTKAWYIRMLP